MISQNKNTILKYVENTMSTLLNIAPHEGKRALLAFLLRLCFQTAFVTGSTVLLALFVGEYHIEKLPLLFIFQSIFVIFGTSIFSGMLQRFSLSRMILGGSLLASALLLSAFFFQDSSLLFFFFLIGGMSFSLAQVSIWLSLFIEKLFTPLEGERIFPLVESSEPIGGILAGVLIIGLLPYFHPQSILLFVLLLVLFLIPLLVLTQKKHRMVPKFSIQKEESKEEKRKDVLQDTIRFFRHSPFFTGIFFVIFLQFFIIHLLEFQYTSAVDAQSNASGSAEGHADALTHSLGALHILINGILLFVQLFFASRIVQKLGIIRSFSLGPISSFFSFLVLLINFQFATAVFAKGSFEVANGISRNSFASVFYAMRERIRDEAKEFLEGIAKPLGSLVGTLSILLLQFLVPASWLSSSLSLALVLVALVASFLAWNLQKHYTMLSRKNLESQKNLLEKMNAIEILSQPGHEHATEYLVRALSFKREIPEVKIKILTVLGEMKDSSAVPALLTCFKEENPDIRLAAINALSHFDNLGKQFFSQAFSRYCVQESLKKLYVQSRSKSLKVAAVKVFANLRDPEIIPFLIDILEKQKDDPEICAETIAVCALFHDASAISYIQPFLQSSHPRVRSASIIALWQFDVVRLSLLIEMAGMLESKEEEVLLAGIYAVGETRSTQEKSRLRKLLKSESENVRQHAAIALAKMNEEEAIEHIISFLFHPEKIVSQKTKKMLKAVHEDIQQGVHKKSLQRVSHRIQEIFSQTNSLSLEELSDDHLEELLHLLTLIGAEQEMWKVHIVLSERKKGNMTQKERNDHAQEKHHSRISGHLDLLGE